MQLDLLPNDVPIPEWWCTKEPQVQSFINNNVKRGSVRTLAASPGGREVKAIFYGPAERELKGMANYNSAIGAGSIDFYYRKKDRNRPVLMLLSGIHGQEVENIAYATSLIKLMETGTDSLGQERLDLRNKLDKLRLIIIPMANPDGRARTPYDGWVGLPGKEMTKYGQGTNKNGELHGWRQSKSIHPMQGDVGILGGYFDDMGVNMQHDEWSSPMSNVTKAILKLAAEEAPDMVINMHSHNWDPSILPVSFVTQETREHLYKLESRYKAVLSESGYGYRDLNVLEDPSKAFCLTSMLNHVCGALCFTHEAPHGCSDVRMPDGKPYPENIYGYKDIMKILDLLINCAADYLINKELYK